MRVLCVLPARIGSLRIPHKPLQSIAGRPLVEWSWRAACSVPGLDRVIVATDSKEIVEAVEGFGGEAVLTSAAHASGTDRVAEVAAGEAGRGVSVVVNYQADEPFIAPSAVLEAVDAVRAGAEVATLATAVRSAEEWSSDSVVKVVRAADGRAIYFSRAPVPHPRGSEPTFPDPAGRWLRHIGLYAYAPEALQRWVERPPSVLERLERLEQLRALEAGLEIAVCVVPASESGVDLPDDLPRAERLLRDENDNLQEIQGTHV